MAASIFILFIQLIQCGRERERERERERLMDWKCGDLQLDHEMATHMQPNFRRWLHRKMNGWWASYITRGGGSAPACVGAAVCIVSMETILAWV